MKPFRHTIHNLVRRRGWRAFSGGALLFAALLAPAVAADLPRDTLREIHREAEALFREANEAAASDPGAATDLYRKALLRFERLVREGGIENGKLYYNIGNCYFRMDELGRAILNYRRAQRFIPNNPNVIQNLEFARSRRQDRIEIEPRARVMRTLLFWHYDFPMRTRVGIFSAAFVLFWALLAVRVFVRRASLAWTAAATGLLACLLAASVLAEELAMRRARPGVIVAEEVVARKGDGPAYEPSFTEPLHEGAEFRLLERRGDWLHIELADGTRCWIPARSAETV